MVGFESRMPKGQVESFESQHKNLKIFNQPLPEGLNVLENGSIGVANMDFFLSQVSRTPCSAQNFLVDLSKKMHPRGKVFITATRYNRPLVHSYLKDAGFEPIAEKELNEHNRNLFSRTYSTKFYRDLTEMSKKKLAARYPEVNPSIIESMNKIKDSPIRLSFRLKPEKRAVIT